MRQEDDVLPRATEPPFLSAPDTKNDTTNLFGYKLGESTENNKAPLKLLTVPFKPLRCCLRSDNLVELPCLKIPQRSIFKLSRDLICQLNRTFLNGFLSDYDDITSCVYTKTIILFNLGE